jgi:hypothetical protein
MKQIVNEILCMRFIADTLEELNAFFAFQFFESTVINKEVMFVLGEFDRLETT